MENLLLEEAFRCAAQAIRLILPRLLWLPGVEPGRHVDQWVGNVRAALDTPVSARRWLQIGSWALEYAQLAVERHREDPRSSVAAARGGAAYDAAQAVAHYAAAHLTNTEDLLTLYAGDFRVGYTVREHLAAAVGEASASWAWSGPMGIDEDPNLRHDFWERWWARCRAAMGARRKSRPQRLWTYPDA